MAKHRKGKSHKGKQEKKKKGRKSSAEKAVMEFLQSRTGGVSPNTVLNQFRSRFSKGQIYDAVDNLYRKGEILTIGDTLVASGKPADKGPTGKTAAGTIEFIRSGAAYVTIRDQHRDVYISRNNTGKALDGDLVEVQMLKKRGDRTEGRIVRVIKRGQTDFVGTLERSDKFAFLVCDKTDMPVDIFIPLKDTAGGKSGDKVIVEMTAWADDEKNPVGRVKEILGKSGSDDIEMKSILLNNGFHIHFPPEVLEETEAIPETIDKEEIKRRQDYRDVLTFTIDPDDAKDFDDAISLQALDNGNWEIGVHIADVSHYVKPGSALDAEALYRSTSVYLPDRVCPMFPEKISNVVCSLRPNEDKLCFSVLFEFNRGMKLTDFRIARTLIHSDKRFTYNEAQEYIEGKEGKFGDEIRLLNRIAERLRKQRFDNGSINFETEEVRFRLDEKGFPVDVFVKERKEAHMLIEDYMLLANKTVAKVLAKYQHGDKQFPSVYRIHDEPDSDKLYNLAHIARSFGHNLKFEEHTDIPAVMNKFIASIHGKPEQHVLETLAIRSMAKAVYSTFNSGHFGLGFEFYTHFTSPIRRYPDVMVHRLSEKYLADDPIEWSQEELEEICEQNSNMERKAQLCEREATKYKQVQYMESRLNIEFEGIISGVIQRGIFVELEANKCEGLIEASKLGYENFVYDEVELSLTGMVSGEKYQIGNKLVVKAVKTDLERRTIDFDLVRRHSESAET